MLDIAIASTGDGHAPALGRPSPTTFTVAALIAVLRRVDRDAEVVALDLSVLLDARFGLVQSITLDDLDDDDGEPDDPEREGPSAEAASDRVVSLAPRRALR